MWALSQRPQTHQRAAGNASESGRESPAHRPRLTLTVESARMTDGSGSRSDGARGGDQAPELTVRGTGPAAPTIAGLTAGGGALLVFVSEHCPTSALALRRLGPLCQSWAQAGLAAIAVFEDPLDVAIRTARRLGWTGQVAAHEPPSPPSPPYPPP